MNSTINASASTPTSPLDEDTANALARRMQKSFPLVTEPFAVLGEEFGVSAEAAMAQVRRWREDGLLREISAVLEGSALGYDSALVAGRVPKARLDEVAEIINAHPTITHNYERDHDYNLWFTIAGPAYMPLEAQLEMLARECDVEAFHPLRRTHTFKIGVNFDLKTKKNATEKIELKAATHFEATPKQRAMFRALQQPLPVSPRPFAALAEAAGVSETELLELANSQLGNAVRKYVATLAHRKLGVRGNGMGVWNVPEEQIEALGMKLAEHSAVSHCYARNAIPGFPYLLYGMMHLPDQDQCREVAAGIARDLGLDDYTVLFSLHEYKKCRLRYFLPELDAWWEQRGGEPGRSAEEVGA